MIMSYLVCISLLSGLVCISLLSKDEEEEDEETQGLTQVQKKVKSRLYVLLISSIVKYVDGSKEIIFKKNIYKVVNELAKPQNIHFIIDLKAYPWGGDKGKT